MKIAVIEDETKMAQALKQGLQAEGFAVDLYYDGITAQEWLERGRDSYDLALLDLVLPGKSGREVCADLRRQGNTLPVMVLTARDTIEEKVQLLDIGADDYLTKPFSYKELLSRVRALLRRPRTVLPAELSAGDLVLSPGKMEARRGGAKIDLTLKEFELLQYLMRNSGRVVSREELLSHVWGSDGKMAANTIDAHIKNLRKKVDGGHEKKLIRTIRGVGYSIQG